MPWSRHDTTGDVPDIRFPDVYNAAVDLVDRHVAEGRGDRVAYVEDRGEAPPLTTTYAQLADRVDRAGLALRALGLRPEQRVLLVMLDGVDFVAAFLGAIKLGAVPVPINTMLPAKDHAWLIRDAGARLVVVDDALAGPVEEGAAGAPSLRAVVRRSAFVEACDGAAGTLEAAPTSADDVAFWLYTSGTTGPPKGAMHLHAHPVRTAALYARPILGIGPGDVLYSAARLFFAYGLGNSLTFPLALGATSVLSSERPTPATVRGVLARHQPTVFFGVPTLYASLLADPTFAPATTSRALRLCTSAGEALPAHVGEAWRARFGVDILDGIGSTEMLHIFLSNCADDVRYGSSGRPVPGYELRLLDDEGRPVADGEEGALWVKGPTAAMAYHHQREKSLATFHGPWTRTGDRYVRDADGVWTCSGRVDDMLKVGGIWVSPLEVESALIAHDAVLEAAVVGWPDDQGLIKPKAFVVAKDPSTADDALAAELKAFVKSRLAPYKYPRFLEFVTDLPKTATGKIQRFKLRP